MRRRARVDKNQPELVEGLRERGYSVLHMHTLGRGAPDLAIGKHSKTWLVEVKSEGGELTPEEHEFAATWKGALIIAYDIWDVLFYTEGLICPAEEKRKAGRKAGKKEVKRESS